MADANNFLMPERAICDVPGCSQPAELEMIAWAPPSGHVYLCQPHKTAILGHQIPMPDARHPSPPKKQS